ncbi:MAG TPA: MBL fold metallo-hydrolase [Gaiellaceae bacterium]|nr:MBL fold metallo-hydrolase [Gaiellaceae bacterium]
MSGLTWLGHSTVVIDVDGTRLLTDPVLRRRVWHLRRDAAPDPGPVHGILVSHTHFDHLDRASLRRLDGSLPIVAPTGAGKLLRGWGHSQVHEVDAGDEVELGGLAVRATPADHESGRGPFSAKTDSLGYIVRGSTTVYFAGDTDLFAGMAELGPMDVAVLPVSGWGPKLPAGHLDPRRAAETLRLLRPRIAVPIHWGTFRTPFASRPDDRPAREFEQAAAELAPEVAVRVLAIGEMLGLEVAR